MEDLLSHFWTLILFMIYLSHQAKDAVLIELERYNFKFKISEKSAVNIAILPFMLIFIYISSFEFRYTTTYYPRLLDAHGKLGTVISKVKNKYGIDSIAIGDAGLFPQFKCKNIRFRTIRKFYCNT